MKEKCVENGSMVSTLSVDELREYFPEIKAVSSVGQFVDARKRGVYFVDQGPFRLVKVRGGCPNFQNGECRLGEKCLSNFKKDETA